MELSSSFSNFMFAYGLSPGPRLILALPMLLLAWAWIIYAQYEVIKLNTFPFILALCFFCHFTENLGFKEGT